MGKTMKGVVRAGVGDDTLFASVAEEEGGKAGEGPVVGGLVVVGVLRVGTFFFGAVAPSA